MSDFIAGDTMAKMTVQCFKLDGTKFDLTNYSVNLLMRRGDQSLLTVAMVPLIPKSEGKAERQFAATDLVEGRMIVEVEVYETAQATNKISSDQVGVFMVRGKV